MDVTGLAGSIAELIAKTLASSSLRLKCLVKRGRFPVKLTKYVRFVEVNEAILFNCSICQKKNENISIYSFAVN